MKEEVMGWLRAKNEKKDNLEIKQEKMFVGQNIKEKMMDEVCVEKEKYFLKKDMMIQR